MMNIVKVPNKILKASVKEVDIIDSEVQDLIKEMIQTLKTQKNPLGVGLAANQVGVAKKVAIIRLNLNNWEDEFLPIINPVITRYSKEKAVDTEGCLSIPGLHADVERAKSIEVEFLNMVNEKAKIKASDFLARVIQHEVDHLDGVLITDRAIRMYTEEELKDKN